MIIKSILDTDLYKFTTSYAYMKLFPQAVGTFEFFDRDNTQYTEEFIEQLRMEISNFCSLRLTHDEQDYMTTHCRFIPSMYWEWLSGVKLNSGKVQVWLDEDKHLHIKVTDYLYRVTLYEVPILAMVSELRNKMLNNTINMSDVLARYKELGIDPTTKTIIFSNALTFDKALEIREYCRGRIRCAFGIGTNLTNDTGHKPSNIVMKLTSCQMNKNQPVFDCVKLSDDLPYYYEQVEKFRFCSFLA